MLKKNANNVSAVDDMLSMQFTINFAVSGPQCISLFQFAIAPEISMAQLTLSKETDLEHSGSLFVAHSQFPDNGKGQDIINLVGIPSAHTC